MVMSVRSRFGFVVEYVADIKAARSFYTDVMGLEVEREHPAFIQFSHFAIASDEPMGGGVNPELYWLVDDAEGALRELPEGAAVTLPLTRRPFGKVFGISNPDGRPCYLLELARDRPSQPVG
jgi:catechol 2,3-dioxygenase-like lactoylglutathione lyase family enzyme